MLLSAGRLFSQSYTVWGTWTPDLLAVDAGIADGGIADGMADG